MRSDPPESRIIVSASATCDVRDVKISFPTVSVSVEVKLI